MPHRNVVSWTSLMVAYSDKGSSDEVINIFKRMTQEGVSCNENTIATVIASCGMLEDELLGYQVLGHIIKYGLDTNISAANSLISMFDSCRNVEEASYVFDHMNIRDTISWNSIISATAHNGFFEESFEYFNWMRCAHEEITATSLSCLLTLCGSVDNSRWGKGIHGLLEKLGLSSNICLSNTILNMYSESGRICDAELVFERMPKRDIISWNSMLASYVQNEKCLHALELFAEMLYTTREINYVTFTSALAACSNFEFLNEGKTIHGLIVVWGGLHGNLIIGNALITMYAKSHVMVKARKVFERMPKRDKVTWNTLIGGHADNEEPSEAVKAFNLMKEESVHVDYITIVNILGVCLTPNDLLTHGRSIHAHSTVSGLELDKHVQSSLIMMYSRCGDLNSSIYIFDRLENKNYIAWNSMITVNARHGLGEEALKLVAMMRGAGIDLDHFSFTVALSVAADFAMLEEGQQLHGLAIKFGLDSDHFITNGVMDMYGKCGEIDEALRVLPQSIDRSRLSWNILISTFSRHGRVQEAKKTFHEMLKVGLKPDRVTFVCLLSAFSHGGLVDEGLAYYASMTSDFGIQPGIEHCVCMIDLLGRSGRLAEAETFIKEMPFPPQDLVWRSLLASCKIHRNLELGRRAAEHLLKLDPSDDSAYVLYSNMFATTGRWEEMERVRRRMESNKIKKKPACSWVKLKNRVSKFGIGDKSHPQSDEISAKLAEIKKMMTETGYVPDTSYALQDTDEEQKEHDLWNHSEKIALAFGLINTPEGCAVKVFKNLRVCGDCHSVYKFVSRIVNRKIILRDPYRFHHFSGGKCSCSDYW